MLGIESEPRAVADARRNLHDLPQVRLVRGRVDDAVAGGLVGDVMQGADVVVLDPPGPAPAAPSSNACWR